jgi:hypothetical protein
MRAVWPEPSPADLSPGSAIGVSEVSRFSCMKFLGVPWVLRPRRTEQKLALSLPSMLPSAHVYRVGARIVYFRGSMATPPILYLRFAGSLAVAAQDSRPSGSLLLPCKALSSPTSCRFIPAHKHLYYTSMRRSQKSRPTWRPSLFFFFRHRRRCVRWRGELSRAPFFGVHLDP